MLSGKAWKHDLLLVVSLVMSFRSRQLSTLPTYNILSGRFPKRQELVSLVTVYHTACYVGCGAIPLYGYLRFEWPEVECKWC